jgi:hypothetical protein
MDFNPFFWISRDRVKLMGISHPFMVNHWFLSQLQKNDPHKANGKTMMEGIDKDFPNNMSHCPCFIHDNVNQPQLLQGQAA